MNPWDDPISLSNYTFQLEDGVDFEGELEGEEGGHPESEQQTSNRTSPKGRPSGVFAFNRARNFLARDITIKTHLENHFRGSAGAQKDGFLELLLKHTTKGVTHESATFSYSPRCLPGTRKTIIGDLVQFTIRKGTSSRKLAWLVGPAGGGKTCIHRSVVEICVTTKNLGASYFFARNSNADGFVATLCHQLCGAIPSFQESVVLKNSNDLSIFDKSLDIQLQRLIIGPLEETCRAEEWVQPRVIVVDGLDECRDPDQRLHVIRLLQALSQHPVFPFHVIIASRPNFDILTAFAEEPLVSLTKPFLLHGYEADDDMLMYLVTEFARIRRTHPARCSIPEGWPTREVLELLVKMGSGQFIFAATIIKYIEHRKEHLDILLDSVLKSISAARAPSSKPDPFAELDALYTTILQTDSDADRSTLRRILHAIPEFWRVVETSSFLTESNPNLGPTPHMLDTFLGLKDGTTPIVLSQLYSLIHVPDNSLESQGESQHICFYHKSMEDFLKSPSRSGDLYQGEGDTVAEFVVNSVKHLQRWSSTLGRPSEDQAATFSALYLCIRFTGHRTPAMCDMSPSQLENITGWIFLYGRHLWPNTNVMIDHCKPRDSGLYGLRTRWLDSIAKGLKMLHNCFFFIWIISSYLYIPLPFYIYGFSPYDLLDQVVFAAWV
ncbi:hypothetical protein MD484_g7368, partial [Candolleomyces efflorescens]